VNRSTRAETIRGLQIVSANLVNFVSEGMVSVDCSVSIGRWRVGITHPYSLRTSLEVFQENRIDVSRKEMQQE
jgi:hypothetical protein